MPEISPQIILGQAVGLHQGGRLADAEGLYRKVLAQNPDDPDALHLLGVLLSQLGRFDEALPLLWKAALLRPNAPDVLSNLAIALAHRGQVAEAADYFISALKLRPDHPDANFNLGNLLVDKGDLDQAVPFLRKAADLQPRNVQAWERLGDTLRRLGQPDKAVDVFRQALNFFPERPELHNFLGVTLAALGQTQPAIDAFGKAISLRPDYADPHNNLGLCLQGSGRIEAAIDEYQAAIRLRPNFAGAYNNLGGLLKESDQLDRAVDAYRMALSLKPDYAQAMIGLAGSLELRGDLDEAIGLYRQAASNRPEAADEVQNALGNALKNIGQVEPAVAAFRRAIQINPGNLASWSNLLFTIWYDPGYDAAQILEEHRRWNRQHAHALRGSIKSHPNNRDPNRRLKLGYVSPDFRQHATAFCTVPLLSNHDHAAFEVFCYASIKKPDPVTERLKRCSDLWLDCEKLSNKELAERIRADGIDILVDLSMHTAGNRLLLFARKPAPVQISWIASPCTTGLETIDYRLTDPYLDPPGQTDAFYSEKSIRLPDSFWCYDPLAEPPPPVNPPPASKNGFITFGCLNNVCKINDGVLSLWSQVLKSVPTSRLLLRCPKGSARDWALRQLNIDPNRVQFADRQPRADYLMTYHRIDAVLDTVPYNGHMTSLDALWMGVPVISLLGRTVVGRAGLSQLSNLGLAELVARDESEFVNIASKLASDLPRLAKLRSELRSRMEQSPLMDGAKFARNVEAAYRGMWRQLCEEKR